MKPHRSSSFVVHVLRLLMLPVLLTLAVTPGHTSDIASSAPAYDAITIARPTDGATVFDHEGKVAVQILLTPVASLRPGERVLVNFDGTVLEHAGPGDLVLRGVEPGEHTLQAMVVDAGGTPVRVSRLVRFNLWRALSSVPDH